MQPPPPEPAEPQQGQLFDGAASPRVVEMPMRDKGSGTKAGAGRSKNAANQPRLFPTQVPADALPNDSTIYCDAPVALPLHRILAASVDASMVLISVGIFAGILLAAGAEPVFNRATMIVYGIAALLTLAGYRIMWCVAGTDSLGMRVCGLRLITFDGLIPDRTQRIQRTVTGCISAMAGGLGLLWSLVDEEKLTWHDHMSKTFPTPAAQKKRALSW
ncbi:MAG: RDD family protein [Bryobacterales bacterium]|nr:RDD family protein [Bryobacterales bacterium]